MAVYHLSVKTISRSQGRSATAAAAYRSGSVIACDRYGVEHDYSKKSGVEHTEIFVPDHAPEWVKNRSELWNAAEAKETRKNSVVAREWEVALPHEITAEERREIVSEFARDLVDRYGVAADVAIHAPGREGDQRNYHAHILTTTRAVGSDGLENKARVLDTAKTGGAEIEAMRERWAGVTNRALERSGRSERVDHRTLEAQHKEATRKAQIAYVQGDDMETARQVARASELDRLPEPKQGVAAVAMERKAKRQAEREGWKYAPVTERGAAVARSRSERSMLAEMRERLDAARRAYDEARTKGADRASSVSTALKALLERSRGRPEPAPEKEAEQSAALKAFLERSKAPAPDRPGKEAEPPGKAAPEPEQQPPRPEAAAAERPEPATGAKKSPRHRPISAAQARREGRDEGLDR